MTLADGSVVERVPVTSLAYSADGATLAVGYSEVWGHSTVELYDVTEGANAQLNEPYWTYTLQRAGWLDLAFKPDETILTGSYVNTIYFWDPITGELLDQHQLFTGDRLIKDMAYSQDGKLLITTIRDQTNRNQTSFWDIENFENVDMLNHLGGLKALNSDTSLMAVAGANEVSLWDLATKTQLKAFEVSGEISAIAFSPNGTLLAFANPGGKIHLWGIPEQ
jgi:WD40 repeat protein